MEGAGYNGDAAAEGVLSMASADVSLEGLLDKINRATLTLHDGQGGGCVPGF